MSARFGCLRWAVKSSFIAYVQGLDDGAIEVFGGCEQDDDGFVFPAEFAGSGTLSFSGGVRFTGFAGMLDVRLADPMIEPTDGATATLTALVGVESIAARAVLATIEGAPPLPLTSVWKTTPRLTFEGVRIFGDVYTVGTELAPLIVERGAL